MLRAAFEDLRKWAAEPKRQPLVLRGARQVGKTWLVESFGRQELGQVATLNLERHADARELWADPSPLGNLRAIEALLGQRIEPGRCLLFLDEIQSAPEVLARLRYFHEEIPELHVVAAGSLLDFALAEPVASMPVGRIAYLHLQPLSFDEFLLALGEDVLAGYLHGWQWNQPFPRPLHDKLLGLCRDYAIVGGMPAVVERYRTARSLLDVARQQSDLLATFRDDFGKYGTRVAPERLRKVLDAVARQAGRKFMFSHVDREERAAHLRAALDCLCKARVCRRVRCVHGNGIPLAAEVRDKEFKVLLVDTGLMHASLGLMHRAGQAPTDLLLINEGALAEHLVGQMLAALPPSFVDPELFYWSREEKGSQAEVDYVVQHAGEIVPVEVKAGKGGRLRSLHAFVAEKRRALAVRVSSEPPQLAVARTSVAGLAAREFRLASLPFYLVGELPRLLDAAVA